VGREIVGAEPAADAAHVVGDRPGDAALVEFSPPTEREALVGRREIGVAPDLSGAGAARPVGGEGVGGLLHHAGDDHALEEGAPVGRDQGRNDEAVSRVGDRGREQVGRR
jgi:hypothetical protein